jgi:hypothetical protein
LQPELLLAAADASVLVAAGLGLLLMRGIRPPSVTNLPEAFQVLDRSISVNMPSLPAGFTWTETFRRLEGDGLKIDWGKMRETLSAYEAYRFGGRQAPVVGKDDVMTLAMKIRRGVIGKGA